jgi:hypothetical protein
MFKYAKIGALKGPAMASLKIIPAENKAGVNRSRAAKSGNANEIGPLVKKAATDAARMAIRRKA